MTLIDVLGHQCRRYWRSHTLGENLLSTLLSIAAVGYFGLLSVGLGWLYPEFVAEVAPRRDPLHLLNQHVFTGLVVLLGARFFLQRSVSSVVRVYLSLPIRRSQLTSMMQITSALSLFNVLPLLVLVTLLTSTVAPSTSTLGAVYWATGGLLGVASTQFANNLLRAAWEQSAEFMIGGMLIVVVGTAGVGIARLGSSVASASAWFFNGLVRGEMLPLYVAMGGVVSLATTAHRLFRKQLYEVLETPDQRSSTSGVVSACKWWMQRRGPVASLAMLDAKLISRNKQPRQALLAQLPILGFVAWQLFLSSPGGTGWIDLLSTQLYCFIISVQFGAAYHGFSYAWHGGHFDGLVVRPQPVRALVRGQYVSFIGLCAGPGVFLIFLAGLTRPFLLVPMGSMLFYHLGITAPLLLIGCIWIRKPVCLNHNMVHSYGSNKKQYYLITGLGIIILMCAPVGLTLWIGFASAMWCVAALGAFGMVVAPYWTRGVETLLQHHRHAMADSFRGKE